MTQVKLVPCPRCGRKPHTALGNKPTPSPEQEMQRYMAMAQEPPVKLGMNPKGFSARRVTLPHSLVKMIPGLDRHYMIDAPDQEVPPAVKLYLQNDVRYRGSFDPNVETAVEAQAEAAVGGESLTGSEALEPSATPASDTPGAYSSKWRMFVLRDYADKNGVKLEATDTTKADVLNKLKAAGLPNNEDTPEPVTEEPK